MRLMSRAANLRLTRGAGALDDAQHDGADEQDRRIRRHNAQRSDDGHGNLPWLNAGDHCFVVGTVNAKASKTFPASKAGLAVAPVDGEASAGANMVKKL